MQNTGTLITSPIRPNSPLDPIASAFSTEIRGGLHTATSSTDRNNIITARRDWGMMCYVVNDEKTYQLTYNYNSSTITDNLNWKEFNGGGSTEWFNSVKSILYAEPVSPTNGDRYLVGLNPASVITGSSWSAYIGLGNEAGFVAEWNSTVSEWIYTNPTENTSVRVDDEDNSIYRYEGIYNNSTGAWQNEKENQVRYISASSSNGASYSAVTTPEVGAYNRETIYIVSFYGTNTGASMSININGLGDKLVKKTDGQSLTNIITNDITTNYQYMMTYNGTYFELLNPNSTSDSGLDIKYTLDSLDYITVPANTQYWVYGDLTIDDGILENYGRVIITNGSLDLINSGAFNNYGDLLYLYFAEIDGTGVTNYLPRWYNSYKLTASSSVYDDTYNVKVTSPTFSINSPNLVIPTGASSSYVLTSNSNGVATWQPTIYKYTATASFTSNVTQSFTHSLNTPAITFDFWNEITGDRPTISVKKISNNVISVNSSVTLPIGRIVIIG